MAGAILVVAAADALASRGTRNREHPGVAAAVQGRAARHLDRDPPDTVGLAHHKDLIVPRAVVVVAAGRAISGRDTRDRLNSGVAAAVESRAAWHLDRGPPSTVRLVHHERLVMGR